MQYRSDFTAVENATPIVDTLLLLLIIYVSFRVIFTSVGILLTFGKHRGKLAREWIAYIFRAFSDSSFLNSD